MIRRLFRKREQEPGLVTLTEKQAETCRTALWLAVFQSQGNSIVFPCDEELLDCAEVMAYLHRHLSPKHSDEAARYLASVDQERAAYRDEIARSLNK